MVQTRLCVALLVLLQLAYCYSTIDGSFKDKKGYTCTYHEDQTSEDSINPVVPLKYHEDQTKSCRELVVKCALKVNGKVPLTTSCTFSGNQQKCGWYNKNQPEFYKHLAEELATVQGGACEANTLAGGNHCPDIKFTKGSCK